MFTYSVGFLRVVEAWFDERIADVSADLVRYRQRSTPDRGHCRDFYTVLIDLMRPQTELLAGVKKDTRYELRRADRDGLLYRHWELPEDEILNQFFSFYDDVASQRPMPAASRRRTDRLLAKGLLDLSEVTDANGDSLVWHAYLRTGDRARLLYSAGLRADGHERSAVGRANRFHHWQDIGRFQRMGLRTYDFGGWYEGRTDKKRLEINRFKEEFGGRIVRNFNCDEALTIRGRFALLGLKILDGS